MMERIEFTLREIAVAAMLLAGQSPSDVARRLGTTRARVDDAVAAILRKAAIDRIERLPQLLLLLDRTESDRRADISVCDPKGLTIRLVDEPEDRWR